MFQVTFFGGHSVLQETIKRGKIVYVYQNKYTFNIPNNTK